MRFLGYVALLLASFAASGMSASPENVLVEGFYFHRPDTWTWDIPPNKSHFINRFVVPSRTSHETDVVFFIPKGDSSDSNKRVLANFAPGAHLTEKAVPGSETKFVAVRGTAIAFVKNPPQPDFCLVGVTLRSKLTSESFFVRIFGPRADVEPALPLFEHMIEEAVKGDWE